MNTYIQTYSTAKQLVRVLIIDTKPRFRAQFELNGLTTEATRRYAKWGYGSGVIPGSYVLPGNAPILHELNQVWRLGGSIAIASAESKAEWPYVTNVARKFYEGYGAIHGPRLLLVDELADFFEMRTLGDIFQRVARNGRERDVGLIAGSQRPRKVPKEIMTEFLRLYMFELQWIEGAESDLKHVMQFGLPSDVIVPEGHTFYMWDRKLKRTPPSDMYYELDLSTNYWTGQPYQNGGTQ